MQGVTLITVHLHFLRRMYVEGLKTCHEKDTMKPVSDIFVSLNSRRMIESCRNTGCAVCPVPVCSREPVF